MLYPCESVIFSETAQGDWGKLGLGFIGTERFCGVVFRGFLYVDGVSIIIFFLVVPKSISPVCIFSKKIILIYNKI